MSVAALRMRLLHELPPKHKLELMDTSDELLNCFLRDCEFDEQRAEQRLKETLKWRSELGMLWQHNTHYWVIWHRRRELCAGTMAPLPPPPTASTAAEHLICHYWPATICGLAKDGTAVQCNRFSKVDWRALVREKDFIAAAVRVSVYLNELARQLQPSGEMTMIFDFGVSSLERAEGSDTPFEPISIFAFLAHTARVMHAHYPFCVRRVLLVRAPLGIAYPWAVAQTIIPGSTTRDVRVFSDTGLEHMRTLMDDDVIPLCLGGRGNAIHGGGMLMQPPVRCGAALPWVRTSKRALWQPSKPADGLSPEEIELVNELSRQLDDAAESGCSTSTSALELLASAHAAANATTIATMSDGTIVIGTDGGEGMVAAAALRPVGSTGTLVDTELTTELTGAAGSSISLEPQEIDASAQRIGQIIKRATLLNDHAKLCATLEILRAISG